MRKFLGLALAFCFTVASFSFAACGGGSDKNSSHDNTSGTGSSDTGGNSSSSSVVTPAYTYPTWLGNSTGATTTASESAPVKIEPGKLGTVATAPKYIVDEDDPTIVRLEETSISFQTVLKEGETEFNWDENSESNKWDTSYVYVDINMTGSSFEMMDTDLDGEDDSLPITNRMFLRIARYGSVQDDQHPYLNPDDSNSNYQCSIWYDNSSIVCFSTTDSYYRDWPTYQWMQKLLKGDKVYLKWQVTYHFVEGDEGAMLFDRADYTVYFGTAKSSGGANWIAYPSLYDPVGGMIINGVEGPNGDSVDPNVNGNTFTCPGGRFPHNGQYVSDTLINVSPKANFDVVVDSAQFSSVKEDDGSGLTGNYNYPDWLGSSAGATTSVSASSPMTIAAGTKASVATAPKYTVDPNDATVVRLEETAISFQTVLKEGETKFNWDENSESNKWDISNIYVDINLGGDKFDLDENGDSSMFHRVFLRVARYGSVQDDQHPYLNPDGSNSNYQCSLFLDTSSIVCFSTTDSYYLDWPTYQWMQKLLAGERVYLKWQVTYHFTPSGKNMELASVDYTVYFGNASGDTVSWIKYPSLYDPVNQMKINGLAGPNGDTVDPRLNGHTLTIPGARLANNGYTVSDTIINVSPRANFSVKVDSVTFGG